MDPLNDRRRAACEGMERFKSGRLARRIATRRRGHGRTQRAREAFRCDFCGFWHVGTPRGVRRWPG